jgi:hypothetical protein
MISRRRQLPIALLLIGLPACRSPEWKQKLLTARSPIATYIEHREKDGKTIPQGFAHPPKVEAETLKVILSGLKYHPTGFIGVSRIAVTEPVFTGEEVAILGAQLGRDLEKIGPDERLRFLLARTSWKPFAAGQKATSGVIFFDRPQRMNLAFDLIDESLPADGGDPRAITFSDDPAAITGKEPVIVPPPGGSLRPASPDGTGYPRWVVLDPRQVAALPAAPAPQAAKASPAAAAPAPRPAPLSPEEEAEAIKRKLKVLDDLKKEGVINAEEYEKTRQEILLQNPPRGN